MKGEGNWVRARRSSTRNESVEAQLFWHIFIIIRNGGQAAAPPSAAPGCRSFLAPSSRWNRTTGFPRSRETDRLEGRIALGAGQYRAAGEGRQEARRVYVEASCSQDGWRCSQACLPELNPSARNPSTLQPWVVLTRCVSLRRMQAVEQRFPRKGSAPPRTKMAWPTSMTCPYI